MNDALGGRVVVVTGAGGGLGRAYAVHLAGLGAHVVVGDLDEAAASATVEQITDAGGQGVLCPGSVTDPGVADALVATAIDRWGRLDGFVNNAGRFRAALAQQEDDTSWQDVFDVNVGGVIRCGRRALAVMVEQGHGALLNVTSGTLAGAAGLGVYAASKAAVAALTWSWADELAGSAVRVNAISPNAHTAMATAYERWLGAAAHGQNVGKPAIANAPLAAYLLSDASAPLTGAVLRYDAGTLGVVPRPQPSPATVTVGGDSLAAVAAAVDRMWGQWWPGTEKPSRKIDVQ